MRISFLFSIVFFLGTYGLSAQEEEKEVLGIEEQEEVLQPLMDSIMTSRNQDERNESAETFLEGLQEALALPNSFDYPFDSLKALLQLYPQDSTFRIMTWQLYVDKDEYKYYGIIQHKANEKKGTPAKVIQLDDYSKRMRSIDNKVFTAQNWYGALYYNMIPFKTKEGMKYALFGFDAYKFFEKRKVMEILSFDESGEPTFGAPVIDYTIKKNNVPPKQVRYNRFVIQYSSEAAASINYSGDEEMILFDHLIPMSANFPGVEYVMVPDGSYEGFKLKKGIWTYVEKVFDHKYEQGAFPVPEPVLDSKKKKKDIFGRPQK